MAQSPQGNHQPTPYKYKPGQMVALVFAALFSVTAGASEARTSEARTSEEWVDLLENGLSGDVAVTQDSTWHLEKGELWPDAGETMTYTYTKNTYTDFELELEVYPSGQTNSGVFVRCPDPEALKPTVCYEFNIWDAHEVADFRTGAIVTIAPPQADVSTEDRWNRMRLRLQGDHLQVWINDVLANDIRDDRYTSGHIAFQYGGAMGMVKFRSIRIRKL